MKAIGPVTFNCKIIQSVKKPAEESYSLSSMLHSLCLVTKEENKWEPQHADPSRKDTHCIVSHCRFLTMFKTLT